MRTQAVRAGLLARRISRLPGTPAASVQVVDRVGWQTGAMAMAQEVISSLGSELESKAMVSAGYGAMSGVALGLISRGLLGQYDAFSARPTLYLLAPNLYELAQRLPGRDEEFWLWVGVHEQTHVMQFTAVPWLGDYTKERIQRIAVDEGKAVDALRNVLTGKGWSTLTAATGQVFAEMLALMTLLEGHADFVTDRVSRRTLPNGAKFRRYFARRQRHQAWWHKLLPAADKNTQYRVGLEFCTRVWRQVGLPGLNKVFDNAASLPTATELKRPEMWLERVHGKA